MADEVTIDELVARAVEEVYERHGMVYHWENSKQETPHYEGLVEVKIANLIIYLPVTHQLGVLVHNQFRKFLPERDTAILPLREGIIELVEKLEAEAKEKQRLKEIAERHKKAAQQESEEVIRQAREEGQKKAPEPNDPGADVKKA